MPRGRQHSPEERDNALEIYRERGPAVAARETGINASTIRSMALKAGITGERAARTEAATKAARQSYEARREEIKMQLLVRIADLDRRMDEPHIDFVGKDGDRVELPMPTAAAVRDYMVSIGIAIDKLRLEEGKVTDRTEHWTQTEFDREVAALVERARSGQTEAVPVDVPA